MKQEELLTYKGYHGTVEYSLEDDILFGKVIDLKSLISYEGTTLKELQADFRGAIDDYLALCKAHHEKPQKAYTGTFNVRLTPQLHKSLALYAAQHKESLNASVNEAVRKLVND